VDTTVGDLLGPRLEPVVELGEVLDADILASAMNRSLIIRFNRSCFPLPSGEYGLEWTRRTPSTAQVRARAALANGAPWSV